ncbi:MAG: site-specific DNA-methyltransferase [Verrucomicrobiota bacterium]
MSQRRQKLELTWIGKENRPRLEPRILLEHPEKSYHAQHRMTDNDLFDNRLIFGDNLLALKALEQEFSGKIKCIYIDPPYNTGSAFEHYDDGIEHSLWLSLIRDRLELLRSLLHTMGVIFVQIDDRECAYLKVLMDEVIGRQNFLGAVVWQKRISPDPDSHFVSGTHDYILLYAKEIQECQFNRLARTEEQDARYENPDNDPRGSWTSSDLTRREYREHDFYPIKLPSGREVLPAHGRSWSVPRDSYAEMVADNRIWFGPRGDSMPRRKRFLSEVRQGVVPTSWWTGQDAGKNEDGKRELKALFPNDPNVFATPKPEQLIKRCLELGSNAGDWVLDSFAGSGTTGAVAHKMGRRWIMVELGEHCHTHIIPRLKKVIDGADPGGITEAVGWKGGGGFRYYRLAPSLLEKDKWGQWVISKEFNAAMLAEAVCKLEGFQYAPSDTVYWQHGHSTERDFIYVTTQHLSADQLAQLSDEVGSERTLLVLCAAFRVLKGGNERYPNLTVKKIPKQVLSRCEWGHDDYSLKVENLPKAPPKPGQQDLF